MRLFRLTFATIFQRKSWALCAFAVIAMPFVLPWISSATEKPILIQPARILAAWGTLWVCAVFWGLFTAADHGETNAKSGVGEYFQTTGTSATRQLFEIWLAIFSFIVPLTLITALICQFAATPRSPADQAPWLILNLQYTALFLLVIAPLLALATAIASRFGGITGFAVTFGITLYGLYGIGYLEGMLKVEANPVLLGLWTCSPHYNLADLTQRLLFKSGSLPPSAFWNMVLYFLGIGAAYIGVSRLCFRPRTAA